MTEVKQVQILGMAGSLRKGSFNAAALRAAQELKPEGMTLEICDLSDIPLYNQDHERDIPGPVQELKSKIIQADGILLVTPEYNYSFSGIIKNALDWASRPPGNTPLPGKPAAIMGASVGLFGTSRAQYHLRQVCVCLNMFVLNRPEVLIANAHEKFDENGTLKDEETRKRIRALLEALKNWIHRLEKGDCR